uniref:Uncharacterized protein n=1 Tax=Arundo donax TaxID=35708 RepID=A0A0A8ZTZ0_ARUDO
MMRPLMPLISLNSVIIANREEQLPVSRAHDQANHTSKVTLLLFLYGDGWKIDGGRYSSVKQIRF